MTAEEAEALDAADSLRFARERFRLPDGIIYLNGNSLGPLPRATPARLAELVERQWGQDLIASWNKHGWIDWPARIAAKLAPLVGAKPNELLIADSTSVCLYKALGAALTLDPNRHIIVSREDEFPTDLYVAQSLQAFRPGVSLIARDWRGIVPALGGDVAALLLSHIDFRGGQRFDMRHYNEAAHAEGALTVWDLSHSAGAIHVDLNGSGCDLAVGCGYKYLNGGPGAPAFLFVSERLQEQLQSPIWGWMGHEDPFAFDPEYRPAAGISRFLTGTPSILALAALEAGLDTYEGVGMRQVEEKSRALAALFIAEVERRCGIVLSSQRDRSTRGSHVVVPHPDAFAVMQALIARGVIGDFREPNLMRFGFAPLYNSFAETVRAAEILAELLATGEWNQPRFKERAKVT